MVTRFLCLLVLLALSASAQTPRIPPMEAVNRNGLLGRWIVTGWQTGNGNLTANSLNLVSPNPNAIWTAPVVYELLSSIPAVSLKNGIYGTVDSSVYNLQSVTVACWVIVTGDRTGYQRVIEKRTGSGNYPFSLRYNAGIFTFSGYNGSSSAGVNDIAVRPINWVHLAGTRGGGKMHLYVNGQLVGEAAESLGAISNSASVGIGADGGGGGRMTGAIRDVRIYNRALSADEIRAIYRGIQ